MKKLALFAALVLMCGVVPAGARTLVMRPKCHDRYDGTHDLEIQVQGETATGKYAFPDKPPETLLVIAHGYSHKSDSWVEHMREAAAAHGVVAVTMDYRGTYVEDGTVRGWFVKEGADDMIAATEMFQKACRSIDQTVLFSVSMGSNAAGLALAKVGAAAPETPLFDYWFNIEGAVNVVETYAGASVLAPANEFAAFAKADIEDEMNGTIADDPEGYADLAVVSHMDEIAASGVKGVVMVHAFEDGLVPYNQAREIIPELVASSIPLEMHNVAGKGDGESGTTITGYSGNGSSPFAGHASERSDTHIVMVTAFERLWQLIDEDIGIENYSEHLVTGV
jgi:hypothetical protein